MATKYDESNIKSLSSLEHIRLRPGMYIGRLGNGSHVDDGIYILLKEVIDNSIDEFIMGAGSRIIITVLDNEVSVRDFGRGIPLGKIVECVSVINTGAKYDSEAFQFSVGLNGVGTKAVNALSSSFTVTSFRDGEMASASFERGIQKGRTKHAKTDEPNGTLISFTPDPEIFTGYLFNDDFIQERLWNYAYLNGGLWLTHWQRNDVTLIGEFAWSIYFRVFTDNHVSMDTVPCPGNGVEAFFWWDDTGGVRHWWNGSGWQTTQTHFLPNYENTESYPSSTIKTEYPNGTEYVGLKGTIMEHVANDMPVSAFGGGIAVRDAWRDFRDGTGETATRVETLYLRDFEIGIGSDQLKYGLDPYTGEPKSSYNYINKNSVNGTDELVEEEFPFHTWSSSPLSGSSLIIGTDSAYDYVAEFGGKKYDSDKRHEEALAEHLSAYYGKPRRRYTLEVHGNPAHHVIYTYKGKRYMELSRVFMPMADMTRLTVEEIMSND